MISIIGQGGTLLREWEDFRDARRLRIARQRSYARAVGLYFDFVSGKYGLQFQERLTFEFIGPFADTLIEGTIFDGRDASGLYWVPKSRRQAAQILTELAVFQEWLAAKRSLGSEGVGNGFRVGKWVDKNRARRSLLGHLRSFESSSSRAAPGSLRPLKIAAPYARRDNAKAFPEQVIGELLSKGLRRPAHLRWTTLRDQMIVLLLHEGGLRLSEALHLWIGDVHDHALGGAMVRVFHPSDGLIDYCDPTSGRRTSINRAQYLRLVYNRAPLTEQIGKQAVGWKEPALDNSAEKSLTVHWRSAGGSQAFLRLYREYLQLRPVVRDHPYLFIASGGRPMNVCAFEKVHAAAVRRIGLEPAKRLGTTPHAHRHAYGLALRRSGVDPKVRQVAMHHKSIFSQEIYTGPDTAEVLQTLQRLDLELDDLAPAFASIGSETW